MPVIKNTKQRGSALIYILIAIALLAALTATFMDGSSTQTSSQKTLDLVSELNSQITLARSSIQECILNNPAGDSTMPANPVGGQSPNRPWPLMPANSYLLNPASYNNIQHIRCPGNPGNSNNHAKIFDGTKGKFFPNPPSLLSSGGWSYYNSSNGVFMMIGTTKSDAYLRTSFDKINGMYAPCEVDVIDATGGAVTMTPDGWACPAGGLCLRYWLMSKPVSMYPNEAGCPPP